MGWDPAVPKDPTLKPRFPTCGRCHRLGAVEQHSIEPAGPLMIINRKAAAKHRLNLELIEVV